VRQKPETLSLELELQRRNGKYRAKKELSVLCAGRLTAAASRLNYACHFEKKRPQVFPTAEMSTYLALARIFSNLNHLLIFSSLQSPRTAPKLTTPHRFPLRAPDPRSQPPFSPIHLTSRSTSQISPQLCPPDFHFHFHFPPPALSSHQNATTNFFHPSPFQHPLNTNPRFFPLDE